MSSSTILQRCRVAIAAGCVLVCVLPAALADSPPAAKSATDRAAALAQLVRGTSTRADVQQLLGPASGTGGSKLPPDWQTRDVWFYELIRTGKMTPETGPDAAGRKTIHVDMLQDILLVFFAGDLFDGYMWYTNVGAAEARIPQ
jgi:hypothetical protein